jgi:hypothetical protein
MSNTDSTKNKGGTMCWQRVTSSCFLLYIRRVIYSQVPSVTGKQVIVILITNI